MNPPRQSFHCNSPSQDAVSHPPPSRADGQAVNDIYMNLRASRSQRLVALQDMVSKTSPADPGMLCTSVEAASRSCTVL